MAGQLVLHRGRQDLAGAVVEAGAQVVLRVLDAGQNGVDDLARFGGHFGSDAVAGHHRDPRHAHVVLLICWAC